MIKYLIAGATGYLGSHLIKELENRQWAFQALARNAEKLKKTGLNDSQIVKGEVTQPESLRGKLADADIVISTVGITRQKDGLTYMDVDYQGNLNLLHEAQKAGVKKFVYISAINGAEMSHLKIMAAKEKFVDALKASGMDYQVVRPNGFFSDMKDFLEMAKSGRVYLFGHGNFKLNPIHGADLAKVILDNAEQKKEEIAIGGPDVLSQNQIAGLALQAYGKPVKITHLPDWIRKLTIKLLRFFTSVKTYGPLEFFLTMMGQDNVAPCKGSNHLKEFFKQEANQPE